MKKNEAPNSPRLGPRPARSGRGRSLSASRQAILESLEAQPEPTSLPALAAISGLHANTVREHLDALIRAGLARRQQARAVGRGRPAWLYEASGDSDGTQSEYAGLASALAAVIGRTSPDPVRDARLAGTDWGRRLAHDIGMPERAGSDAARRQLVVILERMGFEPETDDQARRVRLTRCPLLEAAHQQPDIVCSVHLGIAEGALAEYGVDGSGSELEPFAEPGACLLRLQAP